MKVKFVSFWLLLIAGSAVAADNPETYVVTTVAGIAGVAGSHDGPASEATFNRPTWIDVAAYDQYSLLHKGDIYVVDRANEAIRKISPSGEVSTYAAPSWYQSPIPQTYRFDFGGPFGGGIAIEPQGSGCGGSEYDSGFYVASTGSQQVPLMSFVGILANRDGNVILGGTETYNTAPRNVVFRAPTGIALGPNYRGPLNFRDPYDLVQNRLLYIADTGAHTIDRVHFGLSAEACPQATSVDVFAGKTGEAGFADGVGRAARLNAPRGLATASDGSLYVADSGNHVIRRILADGTVTTVAGEAGVAGSDDGTALRAHLNAPSGIDFDSKGDLFIADTGNSTIRMLTPDGFLITIAGIAGLGGYADGVGNAARFAGPVGVRVTPDGSILVADTANYVIRRLISVHVKQRAVRH